MFTKFTSRLGAALAAFALVGVAGCDMAPAGGPTAAPPAGSGTVDPCSVVPAAVVNTVLGVDAPGTPTLGDDVVSCRWENAATQSSMELEIGAPGSAAGGSVPPADAAEPIPGGDGIEADGSSNLRFAVRDRLCSLRIDAGNIDPSAALRLAQAVRAAVAAGLPAGAPGGEEVGTALDKGGAMPGSASGSSAPGTLAGQAVHYGGFKVTFRGVSQVPSGNGASEVVIPVTLENTGTGKQLPLNDGSNYREVTLTSGGSNTPFTGTLSEVPGGATSDGELRFQVDPSFNLADAVLTIGAASTEQVVVPLGGTGQLVAFAPAPITVSGTVQAGQLSVSVKSGELRAGLPPDNRQAPRSKRYVHLVLDAAWADQDPGNLTVTNFTLAMPNGAKASAETTADFFSEVLQRQAPARDLNLWFIVDAPTAGEYRLLVNNRGVESALPFTVS